MSSNPPQAQVAISPLAVATAFIKQYYLILSTNNSFIHKFYKAESQISFSPSFNTPAVSQPFSSLENVEENFAWAANSRVDFANGSIDAQESVGGGILVVVTGEIFLEGKSDKKLFVQTFFLKDDGKRAAPRRNYFVFNDVFRFLERDNSIEAPKVQKDVADDVDDTLANKNVTVNNDASKHSETAETLELNGNNGKSEAPHQPESGDSTESEPTLEPEMKSISNEVTKEPEKPSDEEKILVTEESELETENKVNVEPSDKPEPTLASPKDETAAESPSQETVNNVKTKAPNNKQKPKPPGSWASLVAGSSPKSPSSQTETPASLPVAKSSTKKEKESSNNTSSTSNDRSKRPPRPQEPETESSTPAATSVRASGYGSKGSSSLYIKNVGEGINESHLKDLFGEYPFKIVNVSFYPNRGYAFVDFADANAVNSIMKENRQTFHINGRAIEVEKKSSDRRRSGGNSGGSGNGPRGGGNSNGGNGNRRSSPKGQRQRSHSGRRLNGNSDGDRRGRKSRSGGGDKKRDNGSNSGAASGGGTN